MPGQVYCVGISRRRFAGAFSRERTLTYADSKAAAISWNTRRRRQGRKTRDVHPLADWNPADLEELHSRFYSKRYVVVNLCPSEAHDCLIFERPGKSSVCPTRVFPPSTRLETTSLVAFAAFMPSPRELTSLNYTCASFCICTRWIVEGKFFEKRRGGIPYRYSSIKQRDVHLSWAVSTRISLS